MTWPGGRVAAAAVVVVLATACSGEEPVEYGFGEITSGTVVETIAAPATIEPNDRVTVQAPSSGLVLDLLVDDGDVVSAGDVLFQVESDAIDDTIAQAEAAIAAADELGSVGVSVPNLAPTIDGVADRLQSVVPPLLGALTQQLDRLPDDAQQEALDRLTEATIDYERTIGTLREAQRAAAGASSAAAGAAAAQQDVVDAQREQAEQALEAAQRRSDDLLVRAPVDGTVELARGDTSDAAGGLAADLGGDIGSLLGGGSSPSSSGSGPVTTGSEVGAGQPVLTIFDLSSFRVATTIDEIDIVGVEQEQDVLVLVDAFPDLELNGVVDFVAIEPTTSATGGVGYPVRIRLSDVPDDLRLRVGLSGSAEVTIREVTSDTVVTSSALRRRGEQDVLYVVRDGVVREVDVRVVAIGLDTAAVEGDVEPGETIITSGIDDVADGDAVDVP